MTVRTIRDVDEETWRALKEMASKRRLKMGNLLREIASEYKRKPSDSWSKILYAKPILTRKEAEEALKVVAKARREYGYRDVSDT